MSTPSPQEVAEHNRMERKRKPKERLSDLVPTNWCDPLLTGKDAALPSFRAGKWNCRDIERLLRGIQDRIRAKEKPC